MYYDVSCRKQCDSSKNCLEEDCERGVNYIPKKEGLNGTQVTVADLSPLVSYRLRIYAKNRVSEMAERHGVEGNFIAIVVRINGSSELLSLCNMYCQGISNDRNSVSLVQFACITVYLTIMPGKSVLYDMIFLAKEAHSIELATIILLHGLLSTDL